MIINITAVPTLRLPRITRRTTKSTENHKECLCRWVPPRNLDIPHFLQSYKEFPQKERKVLLAQLAAEKEKKKNYANGKGEKVTFNYGSVYVCTPDGALIESLRQRLVHWEGRLSLLLYVKKPAPLFVVAFIAYPLLEGRKYLYHLDRAFK